VDQTLINLALALATNELIHSAVEVMGMRAKVARLSDYINKKTHKESSINIDTRAKSYGISIVFFVVFTGLLFGFYSLIDIAPSVGLKIIIGLLVATYFVTAITVDKFHVDIEQVTKRYRK